MKKYLSLLLIIGFTACSAPVEENTIPEELVAKRELLKTKRTELRELTQFVEELEAAITVQDPDFAPKATLVTATEIGTSDFSSFSTLQATVQAAETAFASGELAGRLLSMTVDEGDNVTKGQLIATIDVESLQTQRAEMETAISLAKTVFERQERLWKQNIGSEIQYLEAKNNYERLQKSLESIDVNLGKRNVYAPITGTVERVNMRAGETAMPGAPIVSILSTNKLKIVADAPEEFLTKVKRNQRVKVNVPTLEASFDGRITKIGKTVDPANRTFEVDVEIPRAFQSRLKTNILAEVEVLDAEYEDVIVLSQNLIQQEIGGRRFVFLKGEDEEGNLQARKVYITTGVSFDNQAIVSEGLTPGDQLILEGSRGLVDGQPISIAAETTENNG